MNRFEYSHDKNASDADHQNLGHANLGDASTFQDDISSGLGKPSKEHDELGEKFREFLTPAKKEKAEQTEVDGEELSHSWHSSPIQHVYNPQYKVAAKGSQLELNDTNSTAAEPTAYNSAQISLEDQNNVASGVCETVLSWITEKAKLLLPGKKTTDGNGNKGDKEDSSSMLPEDSPNTPSQPYVTQFDGGNQPKVSWLANDNLNFAMPNILGKNLQDNRSFALLLFPEELTATGLEGWSPPAGVELFMKFIDGFKHLNTQTKLNREVLEECYSGLGDALGSISAQEAFAKEYDTHYAAANDVFWWLCADPKNRELYAQHESRVQKHNLSQEAINALRGVCTDGDFQTTVRRMAIELCTRSSPQPRAILSRLKNDGDCVHLASGWTAAPAGHCTHIILERREGKIYAYEMNTGAAAISSERIKASMYGGRITPGRTIEFLSEKDVLSFVACNFEALRMDYAKNPNTREKEYINMWTQFGKPVLNPSLMGRPRFTEYWQRSGNCVIKSTDILTRTVLQRAMGRKLGKDVNDPEVVRASNKLYRLYAIYSRVQLIENSLNWHKDPENANRINRDSLDMLRRGAGRLGHYLERYAKGLRKKMALSKEEEKLIEYATRLNGEVGKYLELPETREIVVRALPYDKISTAVPQELNVNARTEAKQYAELTAIEQQSNVPQLQHIIFDAKNFGNDPAAALDCAKFIASFDFSRTNDISGGVLRHREMIEQAVELLRGIPLPNEPGWNKYVSELDPAQRREFVSCISKVVNSFAAIPAVGKFLREGALGLSDHLFDSENVSFTHYETTRIINAIAKARIVSFEFAKNDPWLGKYISDQSGQLDSTLFTTFCNSAANFPGDQKDRDEQARLWNYVAQSQSEPKKLFDYTNPKNFSKDQFGDPTLQIYDNLLLDLNPDHEDRVNQTKKLSLFHDRDQTVDLVALHPGLCAYGEFYGSWEALQKFFDGKKGEEFNVLCDFRQIMAYGIRCPIEAHSPDSCVIQKASVKEFPDFFGGLGGGYALKSENSAVKLTAESKKLPLIERLIGEELTRPDTQSFGLLRLLGDNLELCNGFYAGSSGHDSPANSHMNLWLQAFNRVLYPGQYKEADYNIDHAQSPLHNEAKAHPLELLDEIQNLWNKGKKEFWDDIPDKRPKIEQLGALIHVAHLVCKSVIEANEGNQNSELVKQRLQGMLEDVKAAREKCGNTLTVSELMFLRLAENECISGFIAIAQKTDTEAESDLLLDFYENAFRLQCFDSKGLAKGCSEVLYKSIPALADYWQKREFQAKQVAVNLYDRLAFSAHRLTKTECNRFFSAPRNGTGQFGDNHNYVDLINLRICDSGNELKSASRAFEDKDYLRLFPLLGTSSANEITAAGKEYKFTDSGGYGDVIMIESADALKIYRKFADSQMSWRYVAPGQVGVVNLPGCFGGDDFCIWTSENGNFRICAKNNPNEILYETDNLGHLCDMNRRKQGISPYYISFLHSEEAGKIDEFSRFEGKNYTIFYYDDANEVQEVAFPRYRDSADSMLRFSRRGNDWVLSSNPNYKLINAPSFGIAGRKAVEQNLLLGYKDALWLENMAPQSAGVFKGLLPDTSILRARGITHTLYGAVSRPTYANKFFSSAKVAEVSLHANDLDFVSPCLRASDTLSQLRLAYIFQTQGEYALASQCLTNLSATGKFSPDEVNMLSRITVWIIRDVGREINGLSALVVIKALVRMLQNSPLGEDSKKILYQLIKPRGNEFPFNRLFAEYLVGIDLHPQALQLNPWEERVFWENIKMLVPTLPDIANAISVDRDQILWDIGKFPADKVDSRINDLTRLIENGREPMVRAAEKQSKQETGRSEDSMYSIFRESMAMRGIAGVDEAIKSLGAISDQPAYFFAPEPKVASVLLETISPNLFNPTATGEANLDAIAELSPVFSGDERRQFSSTGKTLTDYYNGELVEGAKQLQISQNDAVAQTIPSAEKINNLIATVNGERKIAISMAKYSAQKIEEIANANYAKATHGADAWEPLKMPNALRAYGFYISDKNGRKKALEYLKTGHPWFPTEKLDEFFGCVRNYLSGVTSGRYFDQMTKALGPVADANADESIRTNAWRDALPLLRQTRRNTSEDSELANNMLLFEYMTNIRPRADQTAKIKFIIDEISKPDCDTGALIQQIMGSGKTKVLLPFIVTLLLNRGESLPMVVSHISQLPAVAMELPAILSGVGIRMDVIDMDYSKFSNPQAIRLLREQLEVAFERRDVVPALASHTVLALNTAFLALSGNSKGEAREHRELYIEFKKLFDFCEKRGIALMDEVHLTLNPKESFIIQAPLLGQPPDRISEEDVTFIADLIHGLPDELAKEIRNNAQDQIPAATLKTQLIECVQKKYGELFNVPFELRSNFARFICGDFDGNNSSQFPSDLREFVDGISPKLKQHHVCLLRKLCSSTLPQCLTRVYGEHYGYNNKGEIVPYQNRVPTDNHFQDPHQVLCYYMLATITRGVPDVTLSNWVVKQADVAKSHAASGLPFEQTVEAKFFESLFEGIPGSKLTLLDAVDMHAEGGKTKIRPEALARMQEFLRTHATKTLALTSIFAQDQTSYTSRSYETTPVAISGLFHNTISMSGTLSNRALYPKDVRGAVDLQSGSLGKIAHKLIADEASQKTQIVTADESKLHGVGGMLDQWQTKVSSDKVENLRIIVDYAAQFKDQPVRQSVVEIANFIAHSGNGAKYIEYFDPEIKGFAIVPVDDVTRNGEKFNPKRVTNPVNDRPTNGAELFTFLDSPRTTGTDPLLMSNGHGITTTNLYQNDLDGFLQAIMRERKFLNANGQTMDCILSSKAARDVFNGESVKMEDLLSRMLGNLAKSVTRQQIQAVTLQLRELPKKFIKQKLFQSMPKDNFDNLAWANFEQIRSNTSELMASVENFGVDDWAKCRSWQEVKTVLERQWSGIQSKLRLAFDQQDIAALNWEVSGYINELDRNLQALFFDGHGQVEVGNGEVSVVQEQQQVQEQVQEQEQELKMEQELEQLYQMFRLDLEVAPRRPTEITALRGQAWDVVNKWQPTSFTQMIQWQRTDIVSNLTSKQKEVYDSVYEIANAFSKFDGELLATDNFHRTTTSVQENIFSGYQKNVKYLLMCWDDGGLFRKQIIPKCVFLAENDVDNIRSAIDSGTLTNCYLCTTNGVRISKPANNCEVELSSKQKEFIGQNEWVAHFFNSDIEWLNTHADITEKMFIKMGMPASGRERAQFLKGIRNFLVMRSKDPKETHKAVMDSSLFLHGRLNDPYALFLAEHSLSKFSAPHTIVESIMKMPNWKDLLSLAFDGEASPANVKNTAIEQGKIIENTGIKIENVHEEISTRNREIEEAKKEVSELISNPEFRPELEKEARENRITELRLKISRTEEIVFFLMEKGKEFMSKMVEAKEAIWELLGNVRRGITSLFKT